MIEQLAKTNEKEINLDGVFENFYDHFIKPGNNRILFTAPFGMGKTFFLNHFFTDFLNIKQEKDEKDERYQYIRVSPVNYVPSIHKATLCNKFFQK